MKHLNDQQSVAHYYSRWGSRIGYVLVMKRSQHFGYYDKNHTTERLAQQKYHEEFTKLLQLKTGMKLLDAGCGQGVVGCYIAKHHDVDVTGITITPYEVTSANKRARRQGVASRAHFRLADYATAPFPSESFDRIYTTESLSHAPDVQQVIQGFMKLLKPGGLLVCTEYMMDYKRFDEKTKKAAEFVKERAAIHGIYQFSRGEFLNTLKAAGFVSTREIDWTPHIKPSFDRLRKLAHPIAKVVHDTPMEKYFVNSIAAKLYADGVEDGVFEYKAYFAKKPG